MKSTSERDRNRCYVLGVPVDRLTLREAVDRIVEFIEEGGPHTVLTPNPEMVYRAQKDPELMEILRRADLALADGIGLVWASRYLGDPLPERVAGVDVVEALLRRGCGERPDMCGTYHGVERLRVFLLGTREEVCRRAAERIRALFPGVTVCGYHHGYFGFEEEESVVELVRKCGPHVLLVGMGSPKQEKWLWRHLRQTGAPVGIAVGGCLDVLAGAVARAPRLARRLGLEWLYRLVVQPARLRRMFSLPAFVILVLRERGGR